MVIRRKTDERIIWDLHSQGKTLREIGDFFGVSKTAIRKQLLKLKAKAVNPNPQITDKVEDKARVETEEPFALKREGTRYLRKLGTKEIFAYTDQLMQRGDMVFYTGHLPVPEDFEIPKSELEWLTLVKGKEGFRYPF